jgi:hypothetical protein
LFLFLPGLILLRSLGWAGLVVVVVVLVEKDFCCADAMHQVGNAAETSATTALHNAHHQL